MWLPSGHGPDEDGTADKHNRGLEDTPDNVEHGEGGAPAELETEGMKNHTEDQTSAAVIISKPAGIVEGWTVKRM